MVPAAGDHIPITELDANLVATYVKDQKQKFEEVFIPFKKKCKNNQKVSFCLYL